jgi:hypothetical protein
VLVAGSARLAERAAAELRRSGIEVFRTGRYLGDPVDGFSADWFIRILSPPSPERLRETIARALGTRAAHPVDSSLRSRLLASELGRLRERVTKAETEVQRLKLALAERAASDGAAAALRQEVERNAQSASWPKLIFARLWRMSRTCPSLFLRPLRAPSRRAQQVAFKRRSRTSSRPYCHASVSYAKAWT